MTDYGERNSSVLVRKASRRRWTPMNTDEGEIPFGGRQDARQREKHLVIIGVYPRSSAPDSLAIPFRFSSFVNSYW
jgi:hypothetical protein